MGGGSVCKGMWMSSGATCLPPCGPRAGPQPSRFEGGHGGQPTPTGCSQYLLFLVSYCRMFLMKCVFFRPLCLGDPDMCLVLQVKDGSLVPPGRSQAPRALSSEWAVGGTLTFEPRHSPRRLPGTRGSSAGRRPAFCKGDTTGPQETNRQACRMGQGGAPPQPEDQPGQQGGGRRKGEPRALCRQGYCPLQGRHSAS